jgi:hypothetical protein
MKVKFPDPDNPKVAVCVEPFSVGVADTSQVKTPPNFDLLSTDRICSRIIFLHV